MFLLAATTALGTILQVLVGVVLSLPAIGVARRRRWISPVIAAPVACVLTVRAGGLLLAIPAMLVLLAFFLAFASFQGRGGRWARLAHLLIGLPVAVWTVAQALHLPVRDYLGQAPALVAGNLAGLGLGIAASLAFVESFSILAFGGKTAVPKEGPHSTLEG